MLFKMPDCQVERVYILFLKLFKGRHLIFIGVASQVCDATTLNLAKPYYLVLENDVHGF